MRTCAFLLLRVGAAAALFVAWRAGLISEDTLLAGVLVVFIVGMVILGVA